MGKIIERFIKLSADDLRRLNKLAEEVGYTNDPVTQAIEDLASRPSSTGRPVPDYEGDESLE